MYALSRDAFVCVDGDAVVLLDLKRDKYLGLSVDCAAGVARLVQGWPVAPSAESFSTTTNQNAAHDTARVLLEQGLITTNPAAGKSAAAVVIAPVTKEWLADMDDDAPGATFADIYRFAIASSIAAWELRCLPLIRVVRRAQRRRSRHPAPVEAQDSDALKRAVSVFGYLRPYVLSTREECLFESLALLNFLLTFGLTAQMVFGVRGNPFAAHCWIQRGETVLNDTVESVSRYTPIMVV